MSAENTHTKQANTLLQELKQFFKLQKEYLLLDMAEKLIVILSTISIVLFCSLLGLIVLFFLTFALAYWIGHITHCIPLGFASMALFFLLLIMLIYCNRNRWIIQPIARAIIRLFFKQGGNKV